ncbi:MAG TPA: peptide chain release factor 1 [Candidatus Dormibacteraeota bacterium]|jgi:peptide chain release factor 1|nr:peptide chain release factor 1 [Candidatus Dormibacteraeota bacterium]
MSGASGRLDGVLARYQEIEERLADPEVLADHRALTELGREQSRLRPVVEISHRLDAARQAEAEARELLERESDPEMIEMIKEELKGQRETMERLETELPVLLLPPDPNDDRPVIVEIRSGTGGDEAALFAADLFRMYQRYAALRRWPVEVLDSGITEGGGFNRVTFEVDAPGAYSRLKFESGVHRVQRVPATEAQGRIHTSTASVAVLPEPDELEVVIRDEDIEIDVYRSTGHGGQSVNTTDSAVRITHRPTGLVVTCQDEKSQLKNKNKAMKELAARLYDRMQREQQDAISAERRSMIGSGDRSEKIRTYNFKENRISDERLDGPIYRLEALMAGELDLVIDPLIVVQQARLLAGDADGR